MNSTRNEKYLIAFGLHVRNVRKAKKMSMENVALNAGIEYSQVFDIEHGKINTTISTIHVLSKTLGVHEKELFDFEFNEPSS